MADDIDPVLPRTAGAKSGFTIGCAALIGAVLLAIGGILLLVSGQIPAAALVLLALPLGYFGQKKLRSADRRMR